ncbi:hypothetical protein [Fibrella aquatilis]|uniref:Uncharacterized protein n=1 Tax=Fibrella aquatilis TaxID=2817059 RepID=A0A939G5U8_9BACT|nr:hypothetical protein [Fibrella aquatilis]MBO0930333.1 hypothetical protein [Fibrella aquatilis]
MNRLNRDIDRLFGDVLLLMGQVITKTLEHYQAAQAAKLKPRFTPSDAAVTDVQADPLPTPSTQPVSTNTNERKPA